MKQKKVETLLYSGVGLLVMFAIIVAVNIIMGVFKARIDLTADKLFTLSAGTRAILAKLDSPVEIRLYATRGEGRTPSWVRTYALNVEDLLQEFKQAARGNIEIKKFDPQPDSEAEDLAQLDGIEAQMIPQTGEQFYLGLAVSLDPAKVTLPILSPEREKLLEYDLARAIAQVFSTNKPVIGVMTPLPAFGMPMMNPMMRMPQQQGQEPWVVISELKRDFEVRQVSMDVEKIDDDVKVLLVIHPKEIKETAQYALDQFVLRGGKLIACLDAQCLVDSQRQNPMMGMAMPGGPSNLEKLLKAWGYTFDGTKVVADMKYARRLRAPNGAAQVMPTYLFVTAPGIDKQDILTGQVDELLLPAAGSFSGQPVEGLKETALLKSSDQSQLVDGMMAQFSGQKIVDDFKPSGSIYKLALRLTGKFKTAYPEGKPKAEASSEDEKKEDKDKPKTDEKKEESLKESKGDNVVIVMGDSDWLYDHFSVEVLNFFGQKVLRPRNGNLNLAQGMVEQMAGDQNLIAVRSRATQNRPFTKIAQMQAEAQGRFQEQIAKLQKEQEETQQRVNELQGKKEPGQKFVLSKEQMEEIEKFRQKSAEARKKLRYVRRDLRSEVASLETRLKWINIAAMPVIVALAGIAIAYVRKQRTKAK